MKIALYDIETAPLISCHFGLWDQTIPTSSILQDTFIICAAWQILGKKKIHSVSVLDDPERFKADHTDDYHVVKALHNLFSSCDVIVGHNANNFDWKRFMGRVIYHKLPPLNIPAMVDTLKEARKYGFTSNKLDYLGKHLGVDQKLGKETGLWPKAAQGDKAAIRKMLKYNKGDIPPLRGLYERFRPYMTNHPNYNLYGNSMCCPKCDSKEFQKRGYRRTAVSMFQRFQCNKCDGWFESTVSIKRVKVK